MTIEDIIDNEARRLGDVLKAAGMEIEDAAQEARLGIWLAGDRFLTMPGGYQRRTIRYLIIGAARKAVGSKRIPLPYLPLLGIAHPTAPARASDPLLWRAVDRLPSEHRRLLRWVYQEDQPLNEFKDTRMTSAFGRRVGRGPRWHEGRRTKALRALRMELGVA